MEELVRGKCYPKITLNNKPPANWQIWETNFSILYLISASDGLVYYASFTEETIQMNVN